MNWLEVFQPFSLWLEQSGHLLARLHAEVVGGGCLPTRLSLSRDRFIERDVSDDGRLGRYPRYSSGVTTLHYQNRDVLREIIVGMVWASVV